MLQLIFVSVCFVLFTQAVVAQEQAVNAPKKFSFHSINEAGFVKGASETAFIFQSVNGVQYKTWFGGVGVGLDEYYYSSLPLFIDVRKSLPQNWKSFFVYVDGGINLPIEKKSDEFSGLDEKYKTGMYYDAGIGYTKPLGKKVSLLLSAGYTQKNIKRTETGHIYLLETEQPQFIFTHDYRFKRLSFKMGLSF